MMNIILSIYRLVSAARNATHELAQDFATNENLILLTQKALIHYTPLEIHVISLCAVVEQPVTPTSSSPATPPMASFLHCAWHPNYHTPNLRVRPVVSGL
jgi:hypothetical protein